MDLIGNLMDWVRELLRSDLARDYGPWWMLIGAFLDSGVLPVGVETVIVPPLLFHPGRYLPYGILFLAGSLLGAAFAYWLGKTGGRPLLERLVSEERRRRAEELVRKHDVWAVVAVEVAPIPYTAFTVVGGAVGLPFGRFMALVAALRTLRYGIQGTLVALFGERAWEFLRENPLVLVAIGIALLGWLAHGWWKRRRAAA
jgi:membrane protein YqaA with SNARE-associated domain